MNKINAVFFDIDFTTYNHKEHKVPDSTMQALKELRENNIKIGLCTSRIRYESIHLPKDFLALVDGIVYGAGAECEIDGTIIQTNYVDQDDAKTVIDYCYNNNLVLRWAPDAVEGYFDYHTDEKRTEVFNHLYQIIPTIKKHTNEKIVHLLMYPSDEQKQEIIALLKNSNPIIMNSILEVAANGISKASGIKTMADYWNIDLNNTMAFGDGGNDIDMLKAAHFGVAMGNAKPELKAVADYVCENIEDDGVYKTLKKYQII